MTKTNLSKRWQKFTALFLGIIAFAGLACRPAASAVRTATQVISDFEDGATLMQCTGAASAEISSAQAHSGTKSYQVKLSSGSASINFPFLPKLWGRPVKLNAWIYNQGYDLLSLGLSLKGNEGERIWGGERFAGSPAAKFIPGWQGWKEVVIDTTGKPSGQYHLFGAADGKLDPPVCLLGLGLNFRGAAAETIYLDDITVEQTLDDETVGSLDFGSDHIGNLFKPEEAVNLTGAFANLSSAPFAGSIDCKVFDFFGNQVIRKDFKVSVKSGTAKNFPVDFGKLKRGYYEAHFSATLNGKKVEERETFLVLPERESGDTDIRFGLMDIYPSPKIAKRLGIDLDRAGLNTRWPDMDLGNGKYDFAQAEKNYQPLEQAGSVVVPWLMGFPQWLVKGAGLSSNPEEAYLIEKIDDANWRRILDAWEAFHRALFAHFKGRIHTYELFNEVQCSAPGEANKRRVAQRVADLTIATARARDAVDPSIKLISPSIHSEDTEFLKYFFEYCPLGIVSGIAYHAYRGWMWPEGPKKGAHYFPGTLTLKEGLDNFEKFFAGKGVAKEIWQTEMAYMDTTNPWYGPTYVNGKLNSVDSFQQAAYLARLYLIHFSSPHAGPFCWFMLINDSESPPDMVGNSGILHTNLTPKRSALAYRTTHDRLNNAKFKKILYGQGVQAYLYRRGQTDVLAVWSEFGRRPVGLLNLPASRMYQLDGNYREINTAGVYRLTVDDNPVFFESTLSLDAVVVKPLIEVRLPDEIPGGTQQVTMKVIIRNPGKHAWKAKLAPDLPRSITAAPTEISTEVPAGKEETVTFQVNLTGLTFEGWTTLGVKCKDNDLGALNPGKLATLHIGMPSGWPLQCGGFVTASPILVDLDLSNDGEAEVIVPTDKGTVFAVHSDGTPVDGWPVDIGARPQTTAAGLLELDYKYEPATLKNSALTKVVVGDSKGRVHLLNGDGKEVPGFPVGVGTDYVRGVALGDVDGDRVREIVAVTGEGRLTVLKDGRPLPGFPVAAGNSPTAPALGQLQDGKVGEDIVCAGDKKLSAWNSAGRLLLGFPVELDSEAGGVALGNIDGKGKLEIAVSTAGGSVYAFDARGGVVPGFPFKAAGESFLSPVLADLDGDGRLEIIVASATKLFVVQADGKAFPGSWGRVASGTYPVGAAPIVVDLNRDGVPEIVIPQTGYCFYSLKNDGTVYREYEGGYAGHPIGMQYTSPVVNDLDGDGRLDLVWGNADGNVLWMKLPTRLPEQLNKSWWPRAGCDNFNSNRAGSCYVPVSIK